MTHPVVAPSRREAAATGRAALAAAALAFAAALGALSLGGHALEWGLRDHPDLAPRVSAFDLAAQVHLAAAVGLVLLAALRLSGVAAATALSWAGAALFCGALYAYGLAGMKGAMPLTVLGAALLVAAWLWAAFAALRAP